MRQLPVNAASGVHILRENNNGYSERLSADTEFSLSRRLPSSMKDTPVGQSLPLNLEAPEWQNEIPQY